MSYINKFIDSLVITHYQNQSLQAFFYQNKGIVGGLFIRLLHLQ